MKIKSTVEFSGVPTGTTGTAIWETSSNDYKVTWDLQRRKPIVDWFSKSEFKKYLVVIE